MIALEIVENKTNKVLARFPVSVNDPEPLFVKDRVNGLICHINEFQENFEVV